MSTKIASPEDAAMLISDGDTVATSGFVGIGVPDEVLQAIEKRYLETGSPSSLTAVFAAGQGDGAQRGLNRFGHEGLLKRGIGGHWGLIPKVGQMALAGRIEAWNLPQGVISQMYREIAGGRKGVLTKTGLGTFVDPRLEGGRINNATPEMVQLVEFDGEELLYYPAFGIDVALLRGSTADENGNLSMENEALLLDNLAMAMAARNSGGLVIAQVEHVCAGGALNPKSVVVPAALVDVVVVAKPENHAQTFATHFSPVYAGQMRAPAAQQAPQKLDIRKIIARRCSLELPPGGVVNLGIGMPEGVAAVAEEEGVLNAVTLTAEPGVLGGRPASGLDFGAAVNPDAIIPQNAQFDFYDGGGLDLAVLGMAEADALGNVNVSRFGGRLAGAGGFINISQNAAKVVFAGTFTAGGLKIAIENGALKILSEGRARKFLPEVEQITFSSKQATTNGTEVLYVTERAVFRLDEGRVILSEAAPGIDIQRDILSHVDFELDTSKVKPMFSGIFTEERIGLEDMLFDLHLEDRISLDAGRNQLYLNFERLRIRSSADIGKIRDVLEKILGGHGQAVDVIVNYNLFEISPELEAEYAALVRSLEERYYGKVSRYTSNAFMRLKLQQTLTRSAAPHLFETREEARAFLTHSEPQL
ncbi:acyl CoA:acetate/3-ketoacid CoA transferase [Leisingera sp. D0M16]|uniref:acyl CoA:acetate/3-ketoacid CoA transferase n=1 Tax=Leisingera coralii TaxID=3351347 RepID=UPI003B7F9B4A